MPACEIMTHESLTQFFNKEEFQMNVPFTGPAPSEKVLLNFLSHQLQGEIVALCFLFQNNDSLVSYDGIIFSGLINL